MIQEHTAKVAIITGSGAGIGKACAMRFAKTGMNVVVADISEAAVHSTCKIIKDQGGNAIACQAVSPNMIEKGLRSIMCWCDG